jgi:hypothetical protein
MRVFILFIYGSHYITTHHKDFIKKIKIFFPLIQPLNGWPLLLPWPLILIWYFYMFKVTYNTTINSISILQFPKISLKKPNLQIQNWCTIPNEI